MAGEVEENCRTEDGVRDLDSDSFVGRRAAVKQ